MGSEIATQCRPADNDHRLRPIDCVLCYEHDHGEPVCGAAQDSLQSIHFVNVGHPKCREHSKQNESHAAAEVASVDGDSKLEHRGYDDCLRTWFMADPVSAAPSKSA